MSKYGKTFIIGSMISDYGRTCLEKYPELRRRAITCASPKCEYYQPYSFKPLKGSLWGGFHCILKNRRITIPIINCPDHKEDKKR